MSGKDLSHRPRHGITPKTKTVSGPIALFAQHKTAANLLMALMVVLGLASLTRLNTQFFPTFGIDVVLATVVWQGATAEDVDLNVIQAIEPEVRFLNGVDTVSSTAQEGRAAIVIEFEPGTDMQEALADVESALDTVTTLPEDAEQPESTRIVRYDTINRLVLSGPYSEQALAEWGRRLRDELLDRGISKVDFFGKRQRQIRVDVDPAKLRQLELTIADIARAISQLSLDVPSGDLGNGARQIRALGLETTAEGIAALRVKADAQGREVRLDQVARVYEDYDEDAAEGLRQGKRAIELHVQRAETSDALELASIVDQFVEDIQPTLPRDLTLEIYSDQAALIEDRIDLLVRNAVGGLALVLGVLFIFLNGRIAFWVAVGIPVALLATALVMLVSDQSINMLSLFGMIMAIGIVVDDAIVVGEESDSRYGKGMDAHSAAVTAAQRMSAPVTSSTLTTIAAFLPLLVIGGIIGQIIIAIPLVVIAVLVASLIECFLILPAHMRHALAGTREKPGLYGRLQGRFLRGFRWVEQRPFRWLVRTAVRWRYATMALTIASFMVALGMVQGGLVGFTFFPSPESDTIYGNVELETGSSRDDTRTAVREMAEALDRAVARLAAAQEEPLTTDGRPLVVMALGKVGASAGSGGPEGDTTGDTVGGLSVELAASEHRTVRTPVVLEAWRSELAFTVNVKSRTLRAPAGGPPGRDIDVRLRGDDPRVLDQAAEEVKEQLQRYSGVSAIEDDLSLGKPESILALTPTGRALGFTTESLGQQVRNALQGRVAKRFPEGEDEVEVIVRQDPDTIQLDFLDGLYVRSPTGQEVALTEVASIREDQGFNTIRRRDGRREVSILGDIDPDVTNTNRILEALEADLMSDLISRYPISYTFRGKAEEQQETFADMQLGSIIGLIGIYIILAWVFSSYIMPFAVIIIIPFGFVGATLGHYFLEYDLTILSMVALIGLSGIVVNDSIVLVTQIQNRALDMADPYAAAVEGACDRLRAVMLTSLTTIGGLTPLLFETSLQAQFLIPMALTIVSGLAYATLLVLFVVPALMGILEDISRTGRVTGRWWRGEPRKPPPSPRRLPAPEAVPEGQPAE